jgi:hypothetical protein
MYEPFRRRRRAAVSIACAQQSYEKTRVKNTLEMRSQWQAQEQISIDLIVCILLLKPELGTRYIMAIRRDRNTSIRFQAVF